MHLFLCDDALLFYQVKFESVLDIKEASSSLKEEFHPVSWQLQFYRNLQNIQFKKFKEDKETLTEALKMMKSFLLNITSRVSQRYKQ